MNSTNATTASDVLSVTSKIAVITAYVIIFTIALFGNSIGLYVVCGKGTSRRITNLLIKNLTIADLIFTVIVMPYSVLFVFFPHQWFGGIMGEITCKVVFYAVPVSIAASVTTMVVISLDRFCTVYFPLNQALFHNHRTVTFVIWLFSLISMTPYLFMYQVFKEGDMYSCYQVWPWADDQQEMFLALRIFHIILFFLFYLLPLLIMVVFHFLVGRRLWLQGTLGSTTSENRAAAEVSRRKVVKMFGVLVAVFALCWAPTHLFHYFIYFNQDILNKIPVVVMNFMLWVSHANSAINPMLYIALNKNFRYAFLDAAVALSTCPVRAVSACTTYFLEKRQPRSHLTNDRPFRQRQLCSAFRLAPAIAGYGHNARQGCETKR